ncbi:hypothetical protein DESUT3_08190 [Desulfuromonas versatilis]|uniref:Uncharacterized protein n=1 Tax=Desulfuromonas versatilis TaxID=2802975 RepID=A0ABN6DUH6_9BACT|nr:hypothetical protein DESUT3_08190 [Desulfuromonas versatilis]
MAGQRLGQRGGVDLGVMHDLVEGLTSSTQYVRGRPKGVDAGGKINDRPGGDPKLASGLGNGAAMFGLNHLAFLENNIK